MTLQIDLPPREAAWLDDQARRHGVEPAEIVRKLIEQRAEAADGTSNDATLALFEEWDREDAAKSPEQLADEEAMWERFVEGINAARREMGMRQL